MCTVLLPPGGYPTAVNKYITSHQDVLYITETRIHTSTTEKYSILKRN